MPGFKLFRLQELILAKKRDTMAQVKQQQRRTDAGKFQVRKYKMKKPAPRFAT